ncbi:Dbl homology domain-containing protein [Scheffersomyces amazonensis]|uniref:Dbl homology domain-containing protein n=1 Tax=Scheffersomyces amazonensis TaxID=1078765 RepID=UPI00315DE4AF
MIMKEEESASAKEHTDSSLQEQNDGELHTLSRHEKETFDSFLYDIFEREQESVQISSNYNQFEMDFSILLGNRTAELLLLESPKILYGSDSSRNGFSPIDISLNGHPQLNTALTSSTISTPFLDLQSSGLSSNIILENVSPYPQISFTPISKEISNSNFKARKVLDELVDSEEFYLHCLKILIIYYFDPYLSNNKYEAPVPLKLMNAFIEELIHIHSRILNQIRNHGSDFNNHDPNLSQPILLQIASEITNTQYAIYIYHEYCNIYEDVLQLIENSLPIEKFNITRKKTNPTWNIEWLKGWETYLEASQSKAKHLDLSFASLIQRPTSRVGKYKLLLESLNKCQKTNSKIDSLNEYIKKVDDNLNWINDKCQEFKDNDNSIYLNKLIDFQSISYDGQLSSEFFGKAFLVGYVLGNWVELEDIKKESFTAILYKSHLVLASLGRYSLIRNAEKSRIQFIIPLSKCQFIKDLKDSDGGLYYKNLYSSKIIFEERYCHYEILLTFSNLHEFDVWSNYLDSHINYINGPYAMDFSTTYNLSLCKFPNSIIPYNVSIDHTSSKLTKPCYFKQTMIIIISEEDEKSHELNRHSIEMTFRQVWSKKEIPFISPNILDNDNYGNITPHTLRKSRSWSSTKLKYSLTKNLKNSNSIYELWRYSKQK